MTAKEKIEILCKEQGNCFANVCVKRDCPFVSFPCGEKEENFTLRMVDVINREWKRREDANV